MAITYINGTSGPNNVDGVILGVQSNLEFGSFNGHHQYSVPSASGLTPEETILGVGSEGQNIFGAYDEAPLVSIPKDRAPNLPSGYSVTGVPTFGSGKQNLVYTFPKDYGLTASGSYEFYNGRRSVRTRYNGLTS